LDAWDLLDDDASKIIGGIKDIYYDLMGES